MNGRFYIYVQKGIKYKYPAISGLLYNTVEGRFSFPVTLDSDNKAIGETAGKAIRDFNILNPGVTILKTSTQRTSSSTTTQSTTTQNPPTPAPPPNKTNQETPTESSSGIVMFVLVAAGGYLAYKALN